MTVAYYLWWDEAAQGPFTFDQIREMWNDGKLTMESSFSMDNGENWYPLLKIANQLVPEKAPGQAKPVPIKPELQKVALVSIESIDISQMTVFILKWAVASLMASFVLAIPVGIVWIIIYISIHGSLGA